MKSMILVVFLMLFSGIYGQEKKGSLETVLIQTSAECGDCKDRLEKLLNYTKGVKFAELNLDDMKLTVKYNSKKISLEEIKKKINGIGYDADETKADPEMVKKLPLCCQPGGMKKH
jgi:periplasmic mercuric ion binding protein